MKSAFVAIGIGAAAVAVFLLYYSFNPMPAVPTMLPTKEISVGTTTIVVEVASDQAQEEQGLSGRTSLPEGRGMLLAFEHNGDWGIWMKDMRFPIDILFISETGNVVSINENVSPDTYPQVFYPPLAVRYVLELPAGFAAAHGIAPDSVFLGL
ncbi:MAG TPA: DUF192 domain-containing protein [Candidatus Paceibacterota bacterium]|nr:DUF192 domain-containing protein [Candidatus Paceibacterota bacterium]